MTIFDPNLPVGVTVYERGHPFTLLGWRSHVSLAGEVTTVYMFGGECACCGRPFVQDAIPRGKEWRFRCKPCIRQKRTDHLRFKNTKKRIDRVGAADAPDPETVATLQAMLKDE